MSTEIIRRAVPTEQRFQGEIHPVLQRVFLARGVSSSEELDYSLKHLLPFSQLKNISQAAEILAAAIQHDKRILIVGDFDADGATSCALALRALSAMGASSVEYLVPNRFDYGYGLTPEIVELAADFDPDLIVTVDNGISSIAGVKRARELGIDVLITDHHLAGKELPIANVIVNPNQPGDEYPSKNLAGVGVMFNVLIALRAQLRTMKWFTNKQDLDEPNLANFLDLVALGTVADVVPLDRNNRILVAQGLRRIRQGYACAGIKALLKIARRSAHALKASDLGFAIGPRLNAAGRLTDMSLGIECLLSDDPESAAAMASELDELNRERRKIQADMHTQATRFLERDIEQTDQRVGLCLFHSDWHQGVVGILASKIKERFHRPVIAFAKEDEHSLKGSARSIPGVHIRDVLEAIATRHPGLIQKFGGHAMAAGLSLASEEFDRFSELFNDEIQRSVDPECFSGRVLSDGELTTDELTIRFAQHIEQSGPWGQAFTEPLFDGVFSLVNRRIVGDAHLKLDVKPANSTRIINAIAFNQTDEDWPQEVESIYMAYRLDINEYNGRTSVQLCVEHMEVRQ